MAKIFTRRQHSADMQQGSPNLHATAWSSPGLLATSGLKEKRRVTSGSLRSNDATYPDSSSVTSTQNRVPDETGIPSANEPDIDPPMQSMLMAKQSVPAPHVDNDPIERQPPRNQMETTSREPEDMVDDSDPFLAELRRIRSQMARLQMRVDEMEEQNTEVTESPPMYNQVVSRREANW